MSDRRRFSGGMNTSPAAYSADTRADLPLPAGSILAGRPALEFSEPSEPMLNSFAVISRALLGAVTGLGLAFGLFVLLFVEIH
jgi:hypothetical protein